MMPFVVVIIKFSIRSAIDRIYEQYNNNLVSFNPNDLTATIASADAMEALISPAKVYFVYMQ